MPTNIRTIASLAVCALIATGCASTTGKLAQEQAGLTKEQVDTRGLYAENCARCHGADGRAKIFRGRLAGAQDFTDAHWRTSTSNDDILRAIKNGHEKMPSFDGKLSPAEIEALAAYVETFAAAK